MKQVIRENIKDFHLDHIFDCGQAFRWEKQDDGSYTGVAGGYIANIQFEPYEEGGTCGRLIMTNVTEDEFDSFWHDYLDLSRDYGLIKTTLGGDPVMKTAIGYGEGIRLLQQEPWETLISFIISQNNHIPRIKKCIESLSTSFGQLAGEYCGRKYYSLPSPQVLASLTEEDLEVCRLGYRAKYLIETAKKVCEEGEAVLLAAARPETASAEAYEYITGFHGVGPKVANCIMLFALGKYDSFPLDVWMKRVMEEEYGLTSPKEMAAFAVQNFGEYGGFAQQYLFYYVREKNNDK